MTKFAFRLEPVLKKKMEDEEDAILAKSIAQREYQYQLDVLRDIRNSVNKVMESTNKYSTVSGLIAGNLYLEYLKTAESNQEKVLQDKQRLLDKCMKEMIEARKGRMILEKLRERLQDKYKVKLKRLENKELDDQCTVIAHKKNDINEV